MKTGITTANCAWLLVALLVTGCASGPSVVVQPPAHAGVLEVALGKSAITSDEMRELPSLPVAEQRRRLDVVVAAHPDELGARYLRMQAEFTLQDNAAVVADSDLVLANPSLDRAGRQSTLEMRAEALLQLRRFDESIVVANQVLQIGDSSAEALFTRGWAQFLSHHPDEALVDLDRALQINPDEGVGYSRRATVLREQGKFDRAAKDFERAIELAPDDGPSHRAYGILLFQTRDLNHALLQFDAAARLMPDDPYTLTWRAQTHLASKRLDAAAADERRANEVGAGGEDLIHAIDNVAIVLDDQRDFAGAAREYRRSIALKADPDVATDLARTQWFAGQFAQALETFRAHAVSPMTGDYEALWLFVVRGRADPADEPAARIDLQARVQAHRPHVWTDTLVDLLLGKSTLEKALAEADAADTPKLRAGRRCEAEYYAAEQLLMHRQEVEASRLLDDADKVCPATYMEAHAVDAERRLLAAPRRDVTVMIDGNAVQSRRIPDADDDAQRTVFNLDDPAGGQRCTVVLTLSGTLREPSGRKVYGSCRTDCRHPTSMVGELDSSKVDGNGEFQFRCNAEVMVRGRNR